MPKEPLTIEEQDTLLKAAEKYGDYTYGNTEYSIPVNAFEAIVFMLDTACHPSVLSESKNQLRTIKARGKIYIEWNRPKKKGHDAFTRIRASKRVAPFVEEFVLAEKPRFRQFYNALLQAVGATIKKPTRGIKKDNLSPLALRHTFAVNRLNDGMNPELVRQLMNCSRRTLDYYVKYRHELIDQQLDEIDW